MNPTCRNGHELSPANVYLYKGTKRCRECIRNNRRKYLDNEGGPLNRRAVAARARAALTVALRHPEEFREALDQERLKVGLPRLGDTAVGRPSRKDRAA